jgi:hypothetical protein
MEVEVVVELNTPTVVGVFTRERAALAAKEAREREGYPCIKVTKTLNESTGVDPDEDR